MTGIYSFTKTSINPLSSEIGVNKGKFQCVMTAPIRRNVENSSLNVPHLTLSYEWMNHSVRMVDEELMGSTIMTVSEGDKLEYLHGAFDAANTPWECISLTKANGSKVVHVYHRDTLVKTIPNALTGKVLLDFDRKLVVFYVRTTDNRLCMRGLSDNFDSETSLYQLEKGDTLGSVGFTHGPKIQVTIIQAPKYLRYGSLLGSDELPILGSDGEPLWVLSPTPSDIPA